MSDAPLAPDVPLPMWRRLRALQVYHTGGEVIRDAGGPVAMVNIGPAKLVGRWVTVSSPQGARDVLGGSTRAIDKEMIIHRESRFWGDNVFNMANRDWLPRRRLLQPLFTKKHVAAYASHMAQAAEEMAAGWGPSRSVDLDREMRELTLRVVGRSVFGLDLGSRASELGPDIKRTLVWVTRRATRPVRAPVWLPTPARRRVRRSIANIHAVLDEAISACRTDPAHDAELIRLLLDLVDPQTGKPLTDEAIRAELFAFTIAGHDTTSTTMSYALWALGRNPEIQDRVAAEVAALGDRRLEVSDVAALPFTVQVVHEALRLCPPAPAVGRMAMQDLVVDGFRVPAGTNIMIACYALHRDPKLWDEPERFDPDRFSPERSKGRDRWQFLPFGAGPRSCIGDHFAMLEATLGLASIVRDVEIAASRPEFPVALPFTMTSDGPIPAIVRARSRVH